MAELKENSTRQKNAKEEKNEIRYKLCTQIKQQREFMCTAERQ